MGKEKGYIQVNKRIEVNLDEEPPSSIRFPTSVRIHSGSHDRSIARRREVALLQHLSSPNLASRLCNDLVILASI